MSSSDMRKYAIRRPSDDEETAAAKASPPTAAPQAEALQAAAVLPSAAASMRSEPRETSAEPVKPQDEPSDVSSPAVQATTSAAAPERSAPTSPDKPLSEEERLQQSARNLEAISAAIQAYLQKNGVFPPAAAYDSAGTPLLSWRVLLLPYLGHDDLYNQFKLDEPWYTPHNKQLIDQIPAAFQSPERFDTKTNYLAVIGASAAFDPTRKNGVHPRRFDDGVQNTALVVEADDEAATPWTQPNEYRYHPTKPTAQLGQLRRDHFLVVWGSGLVGLVTASAPAEHVAAMYSRDGGENFAFSMVNRPVELALQQTASASVIPPGQTSSSDGQSPSAASLDADRFDNPVSRIDASGGLADEYFTAARASYELAEFPDALRWWYAAVITEPAAHASHNQYAWIAGLKRPRPTVQFAVGVDYSGPAQQQSSYRQTGQGRHRLGIRDHVQANLVRRGELNALTAPFGAPLLATLEEHAEALAPSWLEPGTASPSASGLARNGRRPAETCHVVYLGQAGGPELIRAATESVCDVLLLFEVQDSTRGTSRTVSLRLVDLERREDLLRTPRMVRRSVDAVSSIDEDEDFRKALWTLRDTLRDKLSPQPWPSQIEPRHAQARVMHLSDLQTHSPLVRLAEMTAYRSRGLINDEQLLAGYRVVVGEEQGISLLLGSDEKKRRILRQWLPTAPPEAAP